MTASNHVVTGALIAAVVPIGAVALPLAFISHFLLDMLPHYGHETDDRYWLTPAYTRVLIADGILTAAMAAALFILQPTNWFLLLLAGVVALIPDILWIPYYIHDRKFPESKQRNPFDDILKKIQWGERPWGIYVEIVWFALFTSILLLALN